MTSFKKIVVAVEETPSGIHALRAAAPIAEAAGATLVALSIARDPWQGIRPEEVSTLRPGTAPSDIAQERLIAQLQQVVGSAIGTARAAPMVRFGNPGIELARWARLEGADLLILGRQPLGQFERRPAGRTLMETLRIATLPCLSVPFGQRTWTHVLGALGSERDAVVSEIATAFAALWDEQPVLTRCAAKVVAAGHEAMHTDPTENLSNSLAVNQLLKLVRDEEHNVLVVDAAAAQVFVERAPCAVLTVPVSTT
jgi:nucleotide-binding universal stress UspA family protein